MLYKNMVNSIIKNRRLNTVFYMVFILFFVRCTENTRIEAETNEILYFLEDSLANQIILDSVFRVDLAPIEYIKMSTIMDTVELVFFYLDDDFNTWTNEMIKRTNRYLKVGDYKIPLIFQYEFLLVLEDSLMKRSEKDVRYHYNWFNYARMKLIKNREFISYENLHTKIAYKVSEEGYKERLEKEKNAEIEPK